ncbi:hypothetical protein BSY18_4097 (plasmid) [Blastomonas sp. RAC04]|nr:hypothetical protein BSY18_4097 [Blastomonas sp. RAC04]
MEHQYRLLFDGLHRNKPHRRSRHRLADRLGFCCISLPTLYIGLYIGGRHQPDLVAQCDQLASPMMGRCTCFHTNKAAWQIGEEADYLCAPKLAPDEDGAIAPDRVNLKNTLRQIQTDGNNLLLHLPTPRRGPTTAHHCTATLVQGSSTPSRHL